MRQSHEMTARLSRPAAMVAAFVACTPTFGQFTSAPGDSRYYTPPVSESSVETVPSEPLLSYRRDDESPGESSAPSQPPTRIAATPPLDGDTNPLRKSPAPPSEAPLSPPATALPAAFTSDATGIQPPPGNSTLTEAHSTTDAASNPFMAAPPLAAPPQPAPVAMQPTEPVIRYDAAVGLAAHEEPESTKKAPSPTPLSMPTPDVDATARRLAPPATTVESSSDQSESKGNSLPFAFSKLESFSTAGAGLAIVVGLFLICVWMLRRGGAKASGILPTDAFAVLGRAPLTSQSFAHLLRLGNKLVLVAMSPDGVQPLTEVTDPMEVDRLTGLCASGRGHGPSAEFQQVLAQLSREPARGFLGSEAAETRRR